MNTDPQEFTDWLSSNYLVDTAVFISDEVEREKVKATNPTRMAWLHQQKRIDELEQKVDMAIGALDKLLITKAYKDQIGKDETYESMRLFSWEYAEKIVETLKQVKTT